jgi:hypothetical protein
MNKIIDKKIASFNKANKRFKATYNGSFFEVSPKDAPEIGDELCAGMLQAKLNKWAVKNGLA